jgi:hypothetical protein
MNEDWEVAILLYPIFILHSSPLRLGMGLECRKKMADPAEEAATANPQSRRDDKPEDGPQEASVVDLTNAGHKETQDRCCSCTPHGCMLFPLIANSVHRSSAFLPSLYVAQPIWLHRDCSCQHRENPRFDLSVRTQKRDTG